MVEELNRLDVRTYWWILRWWTSLYFRIILSRSRKIGDIFLRPYKRTLSVKNDNNNMLRHATTRLLTRYCQTTISSHPPRKTKDAHLFLFWQARLYYYGSFSRKKSFLIIIFYKVTYLIDNAWNVFSFLVVLLLTSWSWSTHRGIFSLFLRRPFWYTSTTRFICDRVHQNFSLIIMINPLFVAILGIDLFYGEGLCNNPPHCSNTN